MKKMASFRTLASVIARCYRTPITAGKRQIRDLSKFLATPKTSFTSIPLYEIEFKFYSGRN